MECALEQEEKIGHAYSSDPLVNCAAFEDWRDMRSRITVPTLGIAGEVKGRIEIKSARQGDIDRSPFSQLEDLIR